MLFGYEDFYVSKKFKCRKLFISVLVSFWKAAKLAVQQRSEKSLQLLSFHISALFWILKVLNSLSSNF